MRKELPRLVAATFPQQLTSLLTNQRALLHGVSELDSLGGRAVLYLCLA